MRTANKKFTLRCTDSQFEQLSQKASQANLPLSHYLIESGLSDSVSLSPHLRKRIDQIKFEAKLLQDHVDLLLNKKSYLEQLLSVGELHNFIFFLTSAAKRLHNIFLVDNNHADINQADKFSNNQFDNNQTHSNHIDDDYQIDNTNQMGSSHIGEVNSSSSERLSDNDTSKDSNGSNSSSSALNNRFGDAQISNEYANNQNSEIEIDTDEVKIDEIKTIKSNSSYSAPISIATLECYVEENVEVVWGFTSATNFFFFYHHECVPILSTDIQDINTTNLDDEILANCISLESDVYASGNSSGVDHNLVVATLATLPINSCNGNQTSLSDTNLDNSNLPNLSNQPISSNLSDLIDKTFTSTQLVNKDFINENLVSQNLIYDNSINESLENLTSQSSMAENLDHNILLVENLENSESTTAITDSNPGLESENLNQLNIASPIDAHIPITCSSPSLDNSNQLNIPSTINASSTTITTTELNLLNVVSLISTNEKSNYAHSHSREDTSNYSSHSNDEDESSSSPLDRELDEEFDGEFVETQFYVVDDASIDPNLLVYLPADNQDFEEVQEAQEVQEAPDNTLISDSNTLSLEVPSTNLNTSTQQNLQQNLQQNFSDEPYEHNYEDNYDFLTQSEEEFNADWDRIHKLIQQTDFSSVDLNSLVFLPTPIDDNFDDSSLDNSNNLHDLLPLDPLDKQISDSDNNTTRSNINTDNNITPSNTNTDNNPSLTNQTSSSGQPYVAKPTNKDFP